MAYSALKKAVELQLADIKSAGLYKSERELLSPQSAEIRVAQGEVINLCANNYLGLANHPDVKQAAADGLAEQGYGMASVRFICGTQRLHKQLENALSTFFGTDDTILYSSCFDANAPIAIVGLSSFALRPRLLPPIATGCPLCTRAIPSKSQPPSTPLATVFHEFPNLRPLPKGRS